MMSIDSADRTRSTPVAPSERAQHLLADSVPNQVWTATPDGKLDYVNARVLEYFGRTFEQMIGMGWQDVIHPADIARAPRRRRSASSSTTSSCRCRPPSPCSKDRRMSSPW